MKKLIFSLLVLSLIGCASKKDVLYFQDIEDTNLKDIDSISPYSEIKTNDILRIRITALDPKSVVPFQFEKSLGSQRNNQLDIIKLDGYLVDKKGNINYPQLGKLHVKGKSTKDLERDLEKKLEPFVKDPTVSVRIVNYKVSVLGAVKKPGTLSLTEENITLPQALGMAGDMTINGERHDVLIIRNESGKRIHERIDLTESEWMNSEFYYLKQNDIVYVPPNNPQVKKAGFIGNIGNVLSLASILLSAAVVIFR